MTDYEKVKSYGLVDIDRWGLGIDHHPKSMRIMDFLKQIDFNDYDDHFCWKTGGNGDNGETLLYQLDTFFELLDREEETL